MDKDDLKILSNAVDRYPIDSNQMAEIGMMSAVLYGFGVDVEKEIKSILEKRVNVPFECMDREVFLFEHGGAK